MLIEAKGLTVRKQGRKILSDINCEIKKEQLTTILGPNGSGKTTFLRALAGLQKINHGQVYAAGKNLSKLDLLERSRLISWCPQEVQIPFSYTVREVILFGQYPWRKNILHQHADAADHILEELNLTAIKNRPIDHLSDGQLRLVTIARSLVGQHEIILLDEPTSNLDQPNTVFVFELLKKLVHRGRSICVITHNINLARHFSDSSILLSSGELFNAGLTSKVLDKNSLVNCFNSKETGHKIENWSNFLQ